MQIDVVLTPFIQAAVLVAVPYILVRELGLVTPIRVAWRLIKPRLYW